LSNIEWKITAVGGIGQGINLTKSGIVQTLNIGSSESISTGLESTIFGLGSIEITTIVKINGETFTEKTNGLIVFKMIFVF
jgi:hypothetical protein